MTSYTYPILLSAAALAILLSGCGGQQGAHDAHPQQESQAAAEADHAEHESRQGEREILYWYDPMHPEHRFDKPGPSPFMDMDLVPRYADDIEEGVVPVARSMQQVMNIRTARVEQGTLARRIDTVGHVGYDETRLHHLHPRVEGWIEHLGVSDEGDRVQTGQLLYTLYSPTLVNAQEELLHALRRGDTTALRSAREKLRAFDVQPEVIAQIEQRREVQRNLPWRARRDGVVSMLGVRHGMHVTPGTEIMEMADLSTVWVIAEVFDRHADWVATGQQAEVASSFNPGETRSAEIQHVYPLLNRTTRTVRVRLPIDNADGRLKPGMWTSVRIHAAPQDDVINIPREALIRTGHEARVVVREDEEHFRVRIVVPGMESGERIAIREGLAVGEEVVVSGQFLLDSEASIRGGFGRLDHDH